MKRTIFLITGLTAVFAFVGPAIAEDAYYVQSLKAKVMSGASFKAGVVGEVVKGYKFIALGREGNWMKVKYDDKAGYVSALLLSPRPPMATVGLIKGEDTEIKAGVRRRASTYTSAAAARGLTSEDRRRASIEEEVDYKALETIEGLKLSADEVAKFAEGGRI